MDLDVLGTNNTFQKQVCHTAIFAHPEHAAVALHPLVHGMAMTVNCYPERERIHALVFVYQSAYQGHVLGSAWILFVIPGCQASGGQCYPC